MAEFQVDGLTELIQKLESDGLYGDEVAGEILFAQADEMVDEARAEMRKSPVPTISCPTVSGSSNSTQQHFRLTVIFSQMRCFRLLKRIGLQKSPPSPARKKKSCS